MGGPVEIEGKLAVQEMSCASCQARWNDIFARFNAVDVDRVNAEEVAPPDTVNGSPREYLVRWEIDTEAVTPHEAAARALAVQRDGDPANTATIFEVTDKVTGMVTTVDLATETDPYETH